MSRIAADYGRPRISRIAADSGQAADLADRRRSLSAEAVGTPAACAQNGRRGARSAGRPPGSAAGPDPRYPRHLRQAVTRDIRGKP
jgi:hypothetical protein